MAQFNINAHLSNGKRLEWLAVADDGETAQKVVDQVRKAALAKFGSSIGNKRWTGAVASNGYVTVRMEA